jgi:hypothetical protein
MPDYKTAGDINKLQSSARRVERGKKIKHWDKDKDHENKTFKPRAGRRAGRGTHRNIGHGTDEFGGRGVHHLRFPEVKPF